MRERTELEESLGSIGRLERELDDAITLIELGEMEDDATAIGEGEEAIRNVQAEAACAPGSRSRRCSPARPTRTTPSSKSIRGRRHREPGLGQHAHAHVHALGRAAEIQGRSDGRRRRRRGRHQGRDAADQGPQRLWLAEDRERRASPRAHLALRFERAAPHELRLGVGLPRDRRPHPDRGERGRLPHRHLPLVGRRRPARQHDRLGRAHHAHPDRQSSSPASRSAPSTRTAPRRGTCCAPASTSWS